jgi:hypothetical protein
MLHVLLRKSIMAGAGAGLVKDLLALSVATKNPNFFYSKFLLLTTVFDSVS